MGWCTRAIYALLAALVSACIEPSLVPCGEQLCPAGSMCVGDRCATPAQLAACDGVAEGGTCTLAGGVGTCEGGVCVATGCGNGVVDPGEACDDGNMTSGDGCRADCKKVEVCGDGVVDDGEGCDDGNTNPADGCDACAPTTWRATAVIGGTLSATTVGLNGPTGLATDRLGNLYFLSNAQVWRLDASGVVTPVAGSPIGGYSGDGGAATSASLNSPFAIAVDGLGNVYIADTYNNRVRRVDPFGIITTIAGTGTSGYNGDSIAAASAELFEPQGVAVDGLGDVYIADTGNHRIRRVDITGIITTVAGTGSPGAGGDGGAATIAQLDLPGGVALDEHGTLYIADTANNRIRRVDGAGVITTVAGAGSAGFGGDGGAATGALLREPLSVAVDGLGNVYIADTTNYRVRRVDPAGLIATIAGTGTPGYNGDGGAATSAQLAWPLGVAIDGLGNLYVADTYNNRVRRVGATGAIATVAGSGVQGANGDGAGATAAIFSEPDGVAVDGLGNIYVADKVANTIRHVDPSGVITTAAGSVTPGYSGDGAAATSAQLDSPTNVAVDGLGNVYIADQNNNRIRRVDASGTITTFAGTGTPGYNGDGRAATTAQLAAEFGVAVDGLGNLFIADSGNNRVRRVDAAGNITTVAGTGISGFSGDGGAATSARLASPTAVAVDGLGNVYIIDAGNQRIRRVSPAGVITTVAGTGTSGYSGDGGAATAARLDSPAGLAVDALGNLYIADMLNNRVRRVATTGVITTVAGTGTGGLDGDGGPATGAQLFEPFGVAVDGQGNLYIAEPIYWRIRRVDTAGIITTIAGQMDPLGVGPLAHAGLSDPRAVVFAPAFTLFAGGTSGTMELARPAPPWLEVAAGRYPLNAATGALARFRDQNFGTISSVAYDAAAGKIYLTESTANRIHAVTIVDPADVNTWTIAPLNTDTAGGFADGALGAAKFRDPTGLYLDAVAHTLYVADTGNHVIRAIDLTGGVASATVRTVAGTPATLGYFGDDGPATAALLYLPQAITRCPNGDLFIADTGNNRIRRIAVATASITTVLGDGVAASSGEGAPAVTFPVNAPLGLACDALGNLFVTSTTTVRLVPANASGVVDGTGGVQTIYGAPPRDTFPASVTTCLTGLAVVDATTIEFTDACTGLLVELQRGPRM